MTALSLCFGVFCLQKDSIVYIKGYVMYLKDNMYLLVYLIHLYFLDERNKLPGKPEKHSNCDLCRGSLSDNCDLCIGAYSDNL